MVFPFTRELRKCFVTVLQKFCPRVRTTQLRWPQDVEMVEVEYMVDLEERSSEP